MAITEQQAVVQIPAMGYRLIVSDNRVDQGTLLVLDDETMDEELQDMTVIGGLILEHIRAEGADPGQGFVFNPQTSVTLNLENS